MNNAPKTFEAAILDPRYAYARTRSVCGCKVVTAYLKDNTSPTGVVGFWNMDFDAAILLMDAIGRPFPLSPTEGLNKSGATAPF